MANKYKVTVVFRDGDKTDHAIKETWTNLTAKGVKDTLKESLDVFLDDNGKPAEPDRAKIASRLMKYISCDEAENNKIVDSEYARMAAGWPVYEGALAFLKSGKAKWSAKTGDGVSVKIETV